MKELEIWEFINILEKDIDNNNKYFKEEVSKNNSGSEI